MAGRKYQLTIYGASGFTGRLAALYVSRQYGSSGLRWAIAGRSASKLEALAAECGGLPGVVIADSGDAASVKAMVEQTDVLVSCAGPFARYGSPIVEACANAGVDYCDITGETNWVRNMIGLYDGVAKKSGARIVHHCGHDSVPWDLLTLMSAKKLKERTPSEKLARIDMYDNIKGKASGGTLETALGIMFGPEKKMRKSHDLRYDPLLKCGDDASTSTVKAQNVSAFQMGSGGQPHRAWFVMSAVNANAVKRSNALLHYGDRVTYSEGIAFASLPSALGYLLGLGGLGLGLAVPPLRWLLRKFVLPKPGEGPSEEEMARGFLTVSSTARGTAGGVVKATMHFPTDPGYKDTARMLVESGLSFVLDKDKVSCAGGVYTPAAALGEVLLQRLLATGTTFAFHDAAA